MKSITFTVPIQADCPDHSPAKKATAPRPAEVQALICRSTNLSESGEGPNSNLHSASRIRCKQWVRYGSNCFLRDTTSPVRKFRARLSGSQFAQETSSCRPPAASSIAASRP